MARGSTSSGRVCELLRTTDMLSRGLIHVLKAEESVGNAVRTCFESCGSAGGTSLRRDCEPHDYQGSGHYAKLLDRMEKRSLVSRCRETKRIGGW